MSTPCVIARTRIAALSIFLTTVAVLPACDDSTTPAPAPDRIVVVSGDEQYTKKGTELEQPVRVRVEFEGGESADGVEVRFESIEGGGSVSRATATTSQSGETSVRWTLGPNTGTNRLRISTADNAASVIVTATAAEFYCPEEDPTFVQKFNTSHDLMLLTRSSSLLTSGGMPASGVLNLDLDLGNTAFLGSVLAQFDDAVFINVVRDLAFSASGDLYVARNALNDEIVKVAPGGTVEHFATLETFLGAEIAMTPDGILIGCDEFGPFAVTCRDTLTRWEGAVHAGNYPESANNDAVASDPSSGDVYYIALENRRLMRVPLDALVLTGLPVDVVTLERDEADNARGMVVDGTDGSVYILVDAPAKKVILKVTSGGVKSTEFDFTTRGAGDAAGVQRDLAIDRSLRFLYTVDTENNVILLYQIASQQLAEIDSAADPNAASGVSSGERVGLDVIPGP